MAIDAGRHPILETIHNDFVVRNALFSIIGLLSPPHEFAWDSAEKL